MLSSAPPRVGVSNELIKHSRNGVVTYGLLGRGVGAGVISDSHHRDMQPNLDRGGLVAGGDWAMNALLWPLLALWLVAMFVVVCFMRGACGGYRRGRGGEK